MMRKILLLSVLALLACVTLFDPPFTPEHDWGPDVPKKFVYVDSRAEMDIQCSHFENTKVLLGCAKPGKTAKDVCTIVLFRGDPAGVKEHEEKHCQLGKWHP